MLGKIVIIKQFDNYYKIVPHMYFRIRSYVCSITVYVIHTDSKETWIIKTPVRREGCKFIDLSYIKHKKWSFLNLPQKFYTPGNVETFQLHALNFSYKLLLEFLSLLFSFCYTRRFICTSFVWEFCNHLTIVQNSSPIKNRITWRLTGETLYSTIRFFCLSTYNPLTKISISRRT